MKNITVKIGELFDAISELENVKFNIDEEYLQHNSIQIKNKDGEYKNVVALIKKTDTILKLNFSDGSVLKCGCKHLISYDGVGCVFAEELNIGDKISNSDGDTIRILDKTLETDIGEVYDLEIDDINHLYQTSNKIIHHNTKAAVSCSDAFSEIVNTEVDDVELENIKRDKNKTVIKIEKYNVTYKQNNRPFYIFNCGSSQDARALLIGNTFFKKEIGTLFYESEFVKAIRTPNAIIVLDELSRGTHDMHNILMPVIDPTQRYLRLDETENSDIIPVAEGVTFIATANVGTEYTATRVLDKAISARFPVKIEMEPLDKNDEFKLLKILHPNSDNSVKDVLFSICEIADHTRKQIKRDDSKISTFIPTGAVIEMAELVTDGFQLSEIAEVSIYPDYPTDGGNDSERTYMKQLVQKYITPPNVKSPINDPLDKDNDKEVPF